MGGGRDDVQQLGDTHTDTRERAHPEDEVEEEEQVFDAFGAAFHSHDAPGLGLFGAERHSKRSSRRTERRFRRELNTGMKLAHRGNTQPLPPPSAWQPNSVQSERSEARAQPIRAQGGESEPN